MGNIKLIYPFRCIQGHYHEVVRSAAEAGDVVYCPDCSLPMKRVWTVPRFHVKHGGYFNNGLGCYVRNSQDVKDQMHRIKDDAGRELVEVGNEHKANIHKPQVHDYSLTKDEYQRFEASWEKAVKA